jgi:hypothetical protein
VAVIAIEIRNDTNRSYQFLPLQVKMRGALDFAKGSPELYALGQSFGGKPIPGQRLYLDVEKREAALVDPLNSDECADIAQKLARKLSSNVRGVGGGVTFPKNQKFENVDVCTYLHHMRRAVEGGHAVVVQGEINAKVPGVPQRDFIHKRQPDESATTIARLIEQNNLLTALLLETLPADKRKTVAERIAKKD